MRSSWLIWLVLPLLLVACADEGRVGAKTRAPVLRFSAIPDHDETLLRQKYAPVADYLAERLGIDVEYVHATGYEDVVELFIRGEVQLAWFGGLSGVQARAAVPGARAIAQGARDPRFYSYFIAHRDSGVAKSDEFPRDLAGKSFAFGSRGSTSGRLMPEHFVRQHTGKSPEEFFAGPPQFSGAHDKTALLVAAGAVQAGAINYTTYDRMVAEGKIHPDVCRVVWRTPSYPDYNFTVHPAVTSWNGADLVDPLQRALLEMDGALLAAFDREQFIPARNEDFAVMAELAEELGFLRR